VWVAAHEVSTDSKGDLMAGGDLRVDVNGAHPLVERACASPTASNFAWVLLAIYAFLNAGNTGISNHHEVQFQMLVADALLDGRLRVLALVEARGRGPA
jgi:hypothetical protein